MMLLACARVAACARQPIAPPPGVYFDSSGWHTLRLGNEHYEIGISKQSGAITYITDKATGQRISQGTRQGRLWSATFPEGGRIDGVAASDYRARSDERAFGWQWLPAEMRLVLAFTGSSAAKPALDVRMDLLLSEGSGSIWPWGWITAAAAPSSRSHFLTSGSFARPAW